MSRFGKFISSALAGVAMVAGPMAQADEKPADAQEFAVKYGLGNNAKIDAQNGVKAPEKLADGQVKSKLNMFERAVRFVSNKLRDGGAAVSDVASTPIAAVGDAVDKTLNATASGIDSVNNALPGVPVLSDGVAMTARALRETGAVTNTASKSAANFVGKGIDAAVGLSADTLDASAKLTRDPVQAGRDLVGSVVRNTAHLTGEAYEAAGAVASHTYISGANLVQNAANTVLMPGAYGVAQAEGVAAMSGVDQAQMVAHNTVSDAILTTGTGLKYAHQIAGNMADAAIRGQSETARQLETGIVSMPVQDKMQKFFAHDLQDKLDNVETLQGLTKVGKQTVLSDAVDSMNNLNMKTSVSMSETLDMLKQVEKVTASSNEGARVLSDLEVVPKTNLKETLSKSSQEPQNEVKAAPENSNVAVNAAVAKAKQR